MRKIPLLFVGIVVCAAILGGALTVNAQGGAIDPVPVQPPACDNVAPYDHNRDGRLDGADFTMWVVTVHESGLCQFDAPLGSCPAWVDVDRNGIVSIADLQAMERFLLTCVNSPIFTRLRPR